MIRHALYVRNGSGGWQRISRFAFEYTRARQEFGPSALAFHLRGKQARLRVTAIFEDPDAHGRAKTLLASLRA